MTVYTPTEAVLNNIQRGVALNKKYNRNSIVGKITSEQIQKSQEVLNTKGFTLDTIKKMYYELSTTEPTLDIKSRAFDGGPTDTLIKFYANGGSAGLAWTRMILKQEGILKSYSKEVTKEETEKESEDQVGKIAVVKATNDELMQATFVVLAPDEVDLHGDTVSEEEIRKACHNFNQYCQKANLFHLMETDTFSIVESYTLPVESIIEDRLIKKGTWLCTVQCHDEGLWALIKSGDICSVSIGALANVEKLDV